MSNAAAVAQLPTEHDSSTQALRIAMSLSNVRLRLVSSRLRISQVMKTRNAIMTAE
jgi:hypothetical protein